MNGNEYYEKDWQHKIDNDIERIEKEDNVEIVNGFNKFMIAKGVMISTRRNYINKIVMFLNKLNKEASQIGFSDYINFITKFQDCTSSYQVQIYTALKNFSEYLYKTQITASNDMEKIDRPKSRESIETVQKREKSYLTQDEMERLILNAKYGLGRYETKTADSVCKRNYAMVMVMLNTGLRCSAISKLDITDIDYDKSVLNITEKRGKIRTCYITEKLMGIIEDWLLERSKLTTKDNSAMFISMNGNRLSPNMIRKIIEKCGEGIKDFKLTPHKLRATYGTMIYEKTGDIYLTQQCMGHSNIQTTMLYVRGQEEKAQKKAAEIMSSLTF